MNALPSTAPHNQLFRITPERQPREETATPFSAELKRAERKPAQTRPTNSPAPERPPVSPARAKNESRDADVDPVDEKNAPAAEGIPPERGDAPANEADVDAEAAAQAETDSDDAVAEGDLGESKPIVVAANVEAMLEQIVPLSLQIDVPDAPEVAEGAMDEAPQPAPAPVTPQPAAPAATPGPTMTAVPAPAAPTQAAVVEVASQAGAAATVDDAITDAAASEAPTAEAPAAEVLDGVPPDGDARPAAATKLAISAMDGPQPVADAAAAPATPDTPMPAPATPLGAAIPGEDPAAAQAAAANAGMKIEASAAPSAPSATHAAMTDLATPVAPSGTAESDARPSEPVALRSQSQDPARTVEDRVNERINTASVARGLRNAVNQGGGSLTMRLTPHEMGTVRVQMQLVGTAVSAQFHTESEAAHALLTQQLSQLRGTLESQGLSVERLNVQMMPSSTASSSSSNQTANGQTQSHGDQNTQQQASDGRSRGFLGHDGGQGRNPSGRDPQRDAREAFRRLLFNQVA